MIFSKTFFVVLKWLNLLFMMLAGIQMFSAPTLKEAPVLNFVFHFFAAYIAMGAIEKIEDQENVNKIKDMIENGKLRQLEHLNKKDEESE